MHFFELIILITCSYNVIGTGNSLLADNSECGILKVDHFYNEQHIAELDEFPWIGRVILRDATNGKLIGFCNVILITKSHLITTAACVENSPKYDVRVVLGDSNYATDIDCNSNGVCAPPPKQYQVDRIIIHPNYNRRKLRNNIALIRLPEDVEFSGYIRPICLPPPSKHNDDITGQYLQYSGYVLNENQTEKFKSIAHVMSHNDCLEKIHRDVPHSLYCNSYFGDFEFLNGSPLMGVNIVNQNLQNYYLIGIACFVILPKSLSVDIFLKVDNYINWIYHNVNHELPNKTKQNINQFTDVINNTDKSELEKPIKIDQLRIWS